MKRLSETPDRGWCGDPSRGAALGRASDNPATWGVVECELTQVYVDSQGYDPGGSYWGTGAPLFELTGPDETHFFRCGNRSQALATVAEDWPNVTLAPAATLDRNAPCDCEIDVTPIVDDCGGVELTDAQANAVRLYFAGFGAWDECELAEMGNEACAAMLWDWLTGGDESDHVYRGDDGRAYFYAGE